ncbi:MAG: UrcA family protein [Parvularculaceae bacterium]
MKKTIATAIALVAIAGFGASANAAPVRFHYNTQELDNSASVEQLYQRIGAVAKNACASNDPKALWMQSADAQCASDLVNDIVLEIGNPGLSALHAQS